MRLAIIIFVALLLILAIVYVINPFNEVAENDELQTTNDEPNAEAIDEPIGEKDLPEGLPSYPGATFIGIIENEDEDIYEYQTIDSVEDVCAFYIAEFEVRGHEDFFQFCNSEMAEVQVIENSYVITVIADATNNYTEIKISLRALE